MGKKVAADIPAIVLMIAAKHTYRDVGYFITKYIVLLVSFKNFLNENGFCLSFYDSFLWFYMYFGSIFP